MQGSLIADKEQRAIPAALIAFGVLTTTLVVELAWFVGLAPYNNHYFDTGSVVILHNIVRLLFAPLLCWLIYAPGAGLIALIVPFPDRKALSGTEQALLGIGFGACIWYVGLLLVGLAGLYYRWVMAGAALAVIAASSRHAGELAQVTFSRLARARQFQARRVAVLLLVSLVGLWVFTIKALYPGGGGDFYTHYFPYELQVLQSHNLAMNDVWYHFYYSKGDGLFFFAMLLTDPMSQALVTACFVAFAAVAIADLANRLAPGSLWPLCGALVYLLYNAVNLSSGGGGEFQKSHELAAALVTLMAWALCQHRCGRGGVFLAMAAACVASIAIVELPLGGAVSLFFGILAGEALFSRNWRQMWHFCFAGAFAAGTALAIMVLNQIMTGLASDQALGITIRFANFQRLDHLGLLPQIVTLVWLHDNLSDLVPPFGWDDFLQLFEFMRLPLLWPMLAAPVIALLAHYANLLVGHHSDGTRLANPGVLRPRRSLSDTDRIAMLLALLIGMLAVIVLFGGRSQNVSTSRLTTFFVPLLVLESVAAVAWTLRWPLTPARRLLYAALPIAALVATLTNWQIGYGMGEQVAAGTANGLRFLTGRDSLGSAFSRKALGPLSSGLPYGGIDPGTLAAARQLPPDTPIWSTNVDSYCMVPHCNIESVVSYRMSAQMDEILGGPPDISRQLLKEAGLNYFLFSKEHGLLDMLPFSRLFAPSIIGKYLGIAWTDGTTFLLTWAGPTTKPIDDNFLTAYRARLAEEELPWFLFRELIPHLHPSVVELRKVPASLAKAFPWRGPPSKGIDIVSATYGENCRYVTPPPPAPNMFRRNNAEKFFRDACRGRMRCDVRIDVNAIGDPVQGCGKDLAVTYQCIGEKNTRHLKIAAEANGHNAVLECPSKP